MTRGKTEERFERRVQKILESKGWLVINLPLTKFAGQLFDLILIRNQVGIPVEIKGRKTYYPREQREKQVEAVVKANSCFALIKQSKKRGKMKLTVFGAQSFPSQVSEMLRKDLKKWLE